MSKQHTAAEAYIQLAEVFDILYAEDTDCEDLTVRFGIWDANAVPFTYYACVYDDKDNIVCGESSYNSDTLAEAIQSMYNDVVEYYKGDK